MVCFSGKIGKVPKNHIYVVLYPLKLYENIEEFNDVCIEIQKIFDVKFTYNNTILDYIFKLPEITIKKLSFIEDSD